MADDFRDNLIIDRFDPLLAGMRASKTTHMRSENSEDAVSWNVFRTFRQIDPALWLPRLMTSAFGQVPSGSLSTTTTDLWTQVPPPQSLLEAGDEGLSEADVVIQNPRWVLFIEAKLTSDISMRTTTRPDRDQILRNIDVGSHFAGVRDFYFALLVRATSNSPKGQERLKAYRDPEYLRKNLAHRTDGLGNVRGVGLLTWSGLSMILSDIESEATSEFERTCAGQCVKWLQARQLQAPAQ